MSVNLLPEEKETIISINEETKQWEVYTNIKKMKNKLIKLGYEVIKVDICDGEEIAWNFLLNHNKITFRKANLDGRTYTDEEREEAKKRLTESRKKKIENK